MKEECCPVNRPVSWDKNESGFDDVQTQDCSDLSI